MQIRAVVLAALALTAGPSIALGGVAGTGTFSVTANLQSLPVALDGTLDFAPGTSTISGIDLDTASLQFSGAASVGSGGLVIDTHVSGSVMGAMLEADVDGTAVCENPGCVGGVATFLGRLSNVVGSVLPGDREYTLDASATLTLSSGTLSGTGTFGLNGFPRIAVPTGESGATVSDSFYDSIGGALDDFTIDLAFHDVPIACTANAAGFSNATGFPPSFKAISVFVDVASDCEFSGVTACVHYDPADLGGADENDLVLLHGSANGGFVNVTTEVDPDQDRVCGEVSSLSPLVVALEQVVPTTTSTSTVTTTTAVGQTTTTTVVPPTTTTVVPPTTTMVPSTSPTSTSTSSTTVPSSSTSSSTTSSSSSSTSSSTSSSSSHPSSTSTSTTQPSGCTRAPTFDSILCRLDLLAAAVQTADIDRDPLRSVLLRGVARARARVASAEDRLARGGGARGPLQAAAEELQAFGLQVRAIGGPAAIDGTDRAALRALAHAIEDDVRTLARAL
jgi:hypothetical protein